MLGWVGFIWIQYCGLVKILSKKYVKSLLTDAIAIDVLWYFSFRKYEHSSYYDIQIQIHNEQSDLITLIVFPWFYSDIALINVGNKFAFLDETLLDSFKMHWSQWLFFYFDFGSC